MTFRMVAACLALSTSIAAADDGELTVMPSCAEIDASRDTLAAEQRELATRQLARAMEEANLLVVDQGCVDHYVLSHEQVGGELVVRIAGPRGARRLRHPDVARLPAAYARLVHSLMTTPMAPSPSPAAAPAPAPVAAAPAADANAPFDTTSAQEPAVTTAALEPDDDHEPETSESFDAAPADGAPAIMPDRLLYGQFSAGSVGTGVGLGYRRQFTNNALDVRVMGASDDQGSMYSIGARLLRYAHPEDSTTAYGGGGVALAGHSNGMWEGGGPQLEGVVGLEFARSSSWHFFIQAEVALPLYELDYEGATTYSPMAMFSVGGGGGI